MGTGASADASSQIKAASREELTAAFEQLSADDRQRVKDAVEAVNGNAARSNEEALPTISLSLTDIGGEEKAVVTIAGHATVEQLVAQTREQLYYTRDIDVSLIHEDSVLPAGSTTLAALGIKDGTSLTLAKQDAKPLVKNNAEFSLIVSRALATASHPLAVDASKALVRRALYTPIPADSVHRQGMYTEFDLSAHTKEGFPGLGEAKQIDLGSAEKDQLFTVPRNTFAVNEMYREANTEESILVRKYDKGGIEKLRIAGRLIEERQCFVLARSQFVAAFHCALNLDKSVAVCLQPPGGGTLAQVMRNHNLFGNVDVAKFCCASIGLALEHLHNLHIAHRELTPEVFMLDHHGYLKIIDMFCAKVIVTRTYSMVGALGYLPPEILQNKGHTWAVDAWGVGILLFELLTGKLPFPLEAMEAFMAIVKGVEAVEFPDSAADSKPLLKSLLDTRPWERLPMKEGGWDNFQSHEYFSSLDLNSLRCGGTASPFGKTQDWRSNLRANDEDTIAEFTETQPGNFDFEAHFGALQSCAP